MAAIADAIQGGFMKLIISVPDEPTNGDMIQLLMPVSDYLECFNTKMDCKEICVRMDGVTDLSCFKASWWFAPYKGLGKWARTSKC